MKLLLPVSTLVFAAAACCCCGDDMSSKLEELGVPAQELPTGGAEEAAAPPAPASGGVALAGACGKFKDMAAPPGATVMVCSEGGGSDSIVLSGGGAPADNCTAIKAWAEGAGYVTEFDTNAAGTWAVTMKGGADRLTIGCMEMAGSSTTSVIVSPL
ncbi:MAG: hypothetical protein EXR71_08405 [Myxococcales bacterium]|nr:hypothetical protein [Myxococcales bacterium]